MKNEMTLKGIVKEVVEEQKKIKIGEKWYRAKGKAEEYVKKDSVGYEVELKIVVGTTDFTFIKLLKYNKRDSDKKRIERLALLKVAAMIVGTNPSAKSSRTPDAVIGYARLLEDSFNEWCAE